MVKNLLFRFELIPFTKKRQKIQFSLLASWHLNERSDFFDPLLDGSYWMVNSRWALVHRVSSVSFDSVAHVRHLRHTPGLQDGQRLALSIIRVRPPALFQIPEDYSWMATRKRRSWTFHAFSSSCLPEPCARDPRQLQPLGLKRGERSGKPSSRLTRTLGLQMVGQHQPNRAPTDHMLSGLKETIRPMKLRCQNELLSERPITKPFKLTLKTGGEMWRTRQMRSHLSRNLRLEPATLGTSAVPMHQK